MLVATSSSRDILDVCLDTTKLRGYFRGTVTGDEISRGKPHPEIYLRAAKLAGAEPEHCLALEDSETGARAALNAGMKVILIPDHTAPAEEIKSEVYKTFSSLTSTLELF
jgi:beta-phosphoglucomutase-like phosphatase (HAD superfamily)